MNIFVIGGSGLFGRKTVLHLLRDEDVTRVVSMDTAGPPAWFRQSAGNLLEKFIFIQGDISHLDDVLNIIRRYSIDRIVNLAFLLPGTVEANPRLSVKVNQLGMCNAFEAARLAGISRVVYASSEGVYGPQDYYGDRAVTEDDELHPQSMYALAKQLSEMLAERYADLYGMQLTGIRPPIGYGHGGKSPNVIKWFSDLVSLPATGQPFQADIDGTAPHSLASADDVGAFIRLLIKAPGSPHPVYNIGGAPTTMKDVAGAVRNYLPDAEITFGSQPEVLDSAGKGIPWNLSMARARRDFGFATMPLEEAVLLHINDARLEAGLGPITEKG